MLLHIKTQKYSYFNCLHYKTKYSLILVCVESPGYPKAGVYVITYCVYKNWICCPPPLYARMSTDFTQKIFGHLVRTYTRREMIFPKYHLHAYKWTIDRKSIQFLGIISLASNCILCLRDKFFLLSIVLGTNTGTTNRYSLFSRYYVTANKSWFIFKCLNPIPDSPENIYILFYWGILLCIFFSVL